MPRFPSRVIVKFAFILIAALLLLMPAATRAVGQRAPAVRPKIALIIGNQDYDENGAYTDRSQTPAGRLSDLKHPCEDAILIENKLKALGWDKIIRRCNLKRAQMLEAIEDFTHSYMTSVEPFGLIYYAGHGIQVDRTSYIFGVDARFDPDESATIYVTHRTAGNLFKGGIRIKEELGSAIGETGAGLLLLVLDACRDNPIEAALKARNVTNVTGPTKGAPIPGVKQLYSTTAGAIASDGMGDNSPFAAVFATELLTSPTADHLIRNVAHKVYVATKETSSPQLPEEAGSFRPPPPEACLKPC